MSILGGSDIERIVGDIVEPLLNKRTDKAVNEIVEEGLSEIELFSLANELAKAATASKPDGYKCSYASTNKDCLIQIIRNPTLRKEASVIGAVIDAITWNGNKLFSSGEYKEVLAELTGNTAFLTKNHSSGWSIFTDLTFLTAGYNYSDGYIFKALMWSSEFRSSIINDWTASIVLNYNSPVLWSYELVSYIRTISSSVFKSRFCYANRFTAFMKYNYKSFDAMNWLMSEGWMLEVICKNVEVLRYFIVCSKFTPKSTANVSIRSVFGDKVSASSEVPVNNFTIMSGFTTSFDSLVSNSLAVSAINISYPSNRVWNSTYTDVGGTYVEQIGLIEPDFSLMTAYLLEYPSTNNPTRLVEIGGKEFFNQAVPSGGTVVNMARIGGFYLSAMSVGQYAGLRASAPIKLYKVKDSYVTSIKADIGEM